MSVMEKKKEMFLQHDDATPRTLVLPLKWQ
jgi:hypothetical protein